MPKRFGGPIRKKHDCAIMHNAIEKKYHAHCRNDQWDGPNQDDKDEAETDAKEHNKT